MKNNRFPDGWNEERIRNVLAYYEGQSEDDAVAEDEAAFADVSQSMMEIPNELVPSVRDLIADYMQQHRQPLRARIG